mmetsp:Transcript_36163/g.87282  ORF Transcript_36163/g.87282 Transcript_36163/m.87282 type:complete len:215 (+) Transcript_36163:1147-1791(+)
MEPPPQIRSTPFHLRGRPGHDDGRAPKPREQRARREQRGGGEDRGILRRRREREREGSQRAEGVDRRARGIEGVEDSGHEVVQGEGGRYEKFGGRQYGARGDPREACGGGTSSRRVERGETRRAGIDEGAGDDARMPGNDAAERSRPAHRGRPDDQTSQGGGEGMEGRGGTRRHRDVGGERPIEDDERAPDERRRGIEGRARSRAGGGGGVTVQ